MNDLISLPQVAKILGKSRQATWVMYRTGKLTASAIIGSELRPRPLFKRSAIEAMAEKKDAA